MNLPTIQLTYTEAPDDASHRLAPRKLLERQQLPWNVDIPGHGTLISLRQAGDRVQLSPAEGISLTLNGKPVSETAYLTPGDKLKADGVLIDFHFKHEARPISLSSKVLAWSARIAVACFILIEVIAMCGLTPMLSASSLFEASIDKQKLSFEILSTQKRMDKLMTEGALENAMLLMLRDNLNKRVGYMGSYGNMLSPRQRKNMAAELQKINHLLDIIEEKGELMRPDELSLERSVQEIINHSK